ncbi:hypothetical protein ACXWR7_12905, partial [Streptococcus pyogenes]
PIPATALHTSIRAAPPRLDPPLHPYLPLPLFLPPLFLLLSSPPFPFPPLLSLFFPSSSPPPPPLSPPFPPLLPPSFFS